MGLFARLQFMNVHYLLTFEEAHYTISIADMWHTRPWSWRTHSKDCWRAKSKSREQGDGATDSSILMLSRRWIRDHWDFRKLFCTSLIVFNCNLISISYVNTLFDNKSTTYNLFVPMGFFCYKSISIIWCTHFFCFTSTIKKRLRFSFTMSKHPRTT